MELEQRNIPYFKKVAYEFVRKTVLIPTERGGFSAFNLFREFTIDADEDGVWSVTIDADDKALPLLFDYQSRYFKYELWNALNLKGKNQLRMYEILKQFEKIGYRIISLADLK
jgi:plasmid replication initiation protein